VPAPRPYEHRRPVGAASAGSAHPRREAPSQKNYVRKVRIHFAEICSCKTHTCFLERAPPRSAAHGSARGVQDDGLAVRRRSRHSPLGPLQSRPLTCREARSSLDEGPGAVWVVWLERLGHATSRLGHHGGVLAAMPTSRSRAVIAGESGSAASVEGAVGATQAARMCPELTDADSRLPMGQPGSEAATALESIRGGPQSQEFRPEAPPVRPRW
jgi:hypothetical protein